MTITDEQFPQTSLTSGCICGGIAADISASGCDIAWTVDSSSTDVVSARVSGPIGARTCEDDAVWKIRGQIVFDAYGK